jgi:hypothetical protein
MQNNSQWWSFYLVRYAMSSVVGALLVYLILQSTNVTKALLFIPDANELQIAHLILWLAMGVGYCYLASLPMLVFHATRFVHPSLFGKWNTFKSVLSASIPLAILLAWALISNVDGGTKLQRSLIAFGVFLFVLLIYLQSTFLLMLSIPNKRLAIIQAIKELSFKRSLKKPEFNEYIETYRHMREHGNSFAIVLMEIFLALILLAAIQLAVISKTVFQNDHDMNLNFGYIIFSVIAVWVLPGFSVWNWGQRLEKELWHEQSTKE